MKTRFAMVALSLAAGLTGCAHQRPPTVAAVQPAPRAGAPSEADAETFESLLRRTVVRFDYDQATLTAHSQETLERLAQALRERPWAVVLIEGHCDERGTEEYNLALGERRAEAARHYLLTLGVPESVVDAISYGNERPANTGHDEAAWAENRRDEVHPAQRDALGLIFR